jgi:tetratricopeptide (TPR) repeat protein
MQIIGFSNVIASDKFAYLPSIGLLMVLAVFLVWLCTIRFPAHCRIVAAIILLLACAEAAATRRYLAHWRNMITLCEYMLKLAPNAASVHEMLGVALAADGRIDEAINQYNETLLRDPNDADALYNLGNTFRDKGKLDQAVRCYEQGLQVELAELRRAHQSQHKIIPGALNHLYNNLGNILEKQGKLNEAIQNYREAVKFKPDFARGYYNLGNALLSKGQPDEAADCYLKAVQIKPDFIEAHNNLGNILRSQHKFEEAVKHYRQVLKYDPFSPLVHCNIGVALGALGKYNEAVGHLYEALRLKPNSPDIHYNLATVLQSYQNLNEALIHYREALKLRPDWLLPLNDIAWILANHPDPAARNPAEAVTLAERADKLTEHKNAVILNTLAAAYFAAGQTDKAVTAAQTALQLARDSKNDKLAAQILERLESYKKAKP